MHESCIAFVRVDYHFQRNSNPARVQRIAVQMREL